MRTSNRTRLNLTRRTTCGMCMCVPHTGHRQRASCVTPMKSHHWPSTLSRQRDTAKCQTCLAPTKLRRFRRDTVPSTPSWQRALCDWYPRNTIDPNVPIVAPCLVIVCSTLESYATPSIPPWHSCLVHVHSTHETSLIDHIVALCCSTNVIPSTPCIAAPSLYAVPTKSLLTPLWQPCMPCVQYQ